MKIKLTMCLQMLVQVPCYMIVALDASAYRALEALAPGHIVQVVEPLPAEPSYATPGTKQMRQVDARDTMTCLVTRAASLSCVLCGTPAPDVQHHCRLQSSLLGPSPEN